MIRVVIYTTRLCPYCMLARRLLQARNVDYEEIAVDGDIELRSAMVKLSGRRTVPQVFIDGAPVGGYEELAALARAGGLEPLTSRSPR